MSELRVWTCNVFRGHWPVGSAAVVVASDTATARTMLEDELERIGLKQALTQKALVEIALDAPGVRVLCDGDY